MYRARTAVRALALAALLGSLAACAAPAPPGPPNIGGDGGAARPAAPAPAQDPASSASAAAPAVAPSPVAAAGPPSDPGPPVDVKVGITGASITSAPFFYAVEKGYFREQGIGVEFERTGTSDRLIPILATNQVQVGAAGFGAGLFNALSRDVQIKVVADNGHLAPDAGSGAVVARRELLESRALADYPDLRGLTVAIPSRGTGLHITVARALEKGGLTFDDVNLVEVPFGDMSGAIANRAVDVAFHLEPFVTQGVDQSIFGVWKWQDQIYPNQQITLVMYSPEFAANADLARRFMVAWIKGARDYNDAIWKGRNREEYAQLLAQHLPVKDPALYHKMKPIGINPDGYVNVRGIQDDQEWYVANGFVRQPVNVNALVDHSFVDYALQRLGRYQ